MTNPELNRHISDARTTLGRATTERTKLIARRTTAQAAERLDQGYIDNLKGQIEACDRDIANASERIDALTPMLPNADEINAAKATAADFTTQAEAHRAAFLESLAALIVSLQSTMSIAFVVNEDKTRLIQCRARVDELGAEYALHLPVIDAPPTPDPATFTFLTAAVGALRDIAQIQMISYPQIYLDALDELNATAVTA